MTIGLRRAVKVGGDCAGHFQGCAVKLAGFGGQPSQRAAAALAGGLCIEEPAQNLRAIGGDYGTLDCELFELVELDRSVLRDGVS
ncbi:hypothetical protein O6P37_15905 [Mycobacterium sp. CPCC 205372]|uniref:Uncharacterized protein n=1 Tax=Mycobacterium hippophais TaxID=3016340 RepID=A0ABT4PV13_9MYCO|nr:hypothetical protein [Mycobacterium hippophais]MCZ8380353.1 hypothetical protein [Mycobacterium hippophais]